VSRDRDGAKLVLNKLVGQFPRLSLIWADGGYAGQLVEWVRNLSGWLLEIIKRPNDVLCFEVLPHRWIVEWTFAWLGRYRRLSKDYEALPETSEAFVYRGDDLSYAASTQAYLTYLLTHPLRDSPPDEGTG
jgi:putative transposase